MGIYGGRSILLTKSKIVDMVLLAASVILAAAKAFMEQEKSKEDSDETS